MSTRANIRITEGDGQILLYHHFDGYPESLGAELNKFLKEYKQKRWDPENIATQLVRDKHGYECAICLHGDEEYVYVIDCDNKALTCYACRRNETFEQCCIPERICEIP